MKQTYIAAIAMFAAGGCLACLTAGYAPIQYQAPVPAAASETIAAAKPADAETEETTAIAREPSIQEAEPVWQPSVDELNLAHFFPEDADQTDPSQSLGGEIFRLLMAGNGQWMSSIYNYYDVSPEQMAASLSLPRSSILGGYNPKEASHDPANPDTWTINSFKNVRMNVTDGDGRPISVYSNVIEIMSMANQYTYYKGVEDYDLFLSYAAKLWDASHFYYVSMSDIYYCPGCVDEESARRELEELAEQESSELRRLRDGISSENDQAPATSSDADEVPSITPVIVSGSVATSSNSASDDDFYEMREDSLYTAPETSPYTEPDDDLSAMTENELHTTPENSLFTAPETAESAEPADSDPNSQCPGHIDLIIHMKIKGLTESNGLYAADTIGNDPANIEEGGWPGWTEEMKAQAYSLSSQDWFQKYGLSVSLITMTNPLTPSEIDAYMADLPSDLSDTRRELIHYALSSVGKIPYYWGGKASHPDYNGNLFGTLVPADTDGRILKGLDCSGWINWVYWSVTGNRLPYESTSGLALCGTKIGRNELQPGDLVIRTGENAHVIMFLGWTEDGQIRCIHESSGNVNNVSVSVRDANWPYYIRILDEQDKQDLNQ